MHQLGISALSLCQLMAVVSSLALVQDIDTSKPILNRIAGVETNGSLGAIPFRIRKIFNLDTEYENEASV